MDHVALDRRDVCCHGNPQGRGPCHSPHECRHRICLYLTTTYPEQTQASPPAVAAVASEAQAQDVSREVAGEASAAAAAPVSAGAAAAAKSESERVEMDTIGDTAAPQVLRDGCVMRQRMRADTFSPCPLMLHCFVLVKLQATTAVTAVVVLIVERCSTSGHKNFVSGTGTLEQNCHKRTINNTYQVPR